MVTQADQAKTRLMAQFDKSYGAGTMTVKDKNVLDVIPTGSMALDRALATGGYVKGRLTEIWGPPAGGKSSLTLIAAGIAQKLNPDKYVIYVDVEHTYDPEWARALGVDTDRVLHIDPLSAENVADMVKDSIRSNAACMLIIDSIGAVLTNNEFESAAGDSNMGKRAQVVSRMILIAAGLAPRHNVAVLIINQARANFGYGADTKPSGGFVPGHSMTQRLNVKRASSAYTIGTDDNKVNVGYEMGVKIERNKLGPEGRNVKFDFYTVEHDNKGVRNPVGIDKIQEAFILGTRDKYIETNGAYYTIGGTKVQGKEKAMDLLRQNPEIVEEIRTKIVNAVADQIKDDNEVITLTPAQIKEAGIA